MNFNTRHAILVGYLLSILMVSFFAFYTNREMRKVQYESRRSENVLLSLRTVEAILDDMQALESGARGFIITGDELFLDDYHWGLQGIGRDSARLKSLYDLFPEMRGEYEGLLNLVRAKLDYTARTVESRRENGLERTIEMVRSGDGHRIMDSLQSSLYRIENEDRRLLAIENQERQDAARSTSRLFNIMAILFLVFLSILFWMVYQGIRFQEKNEQQIAYLARLTENTSDAIISADLNGYIRSWNRAACRIFGFEPEEAIGRFGPEVTGSGVTKEQVQFLRRQLEEKEEVTMEMSQYHKSGKVVYSLASTSALRNAKGEVEGFVTIVKDITDRRILEEKLQVFNQELSRQVEEKTATLMRLNEQLERTNHDLEQFAYVASHDLQEPLRTIRSFLQLIEKKYGSQLDEEGRKYISYAVDGAGRMKQLVSDLLNFSRLGTRGLRYELVDMEKLVYQVLDGLERRINETGAIVNVGKLPVVKCDKSQMQQVFQNLVSNALKYHRLGILPEVELGCREEGGIHEFFVRDNGIGIQSSDHQSIFQLFHRLHSEKEYPGSGMGLAICKKVVELHGGHMRVESNPGEGTTFYFTLPAT